MAKNSAAPLWQESLCFVSFDERLRQHQKYTQLQHDRERYEAEQQGLANQWSAELQKPNLDLTFLELPLFFRILSDCDLEVLREDPLLAADVSTDFSVGQPEEGLSVAEPADKIDDDPEPTEEDKVGYIEFMASDPLAFLEFILERNLKFLTTVGNAVEKKTIIEWVFTPEIDGQVYDFRSGGSGKPIPLESVKLPFSFAWLCKHLGYDAYDIRQELIGALQRARDLATGRKRNVMDEAARLAKEKAMQ